VALTATRRDDNRTMTFFRDTFEELRKVVWPTLPELYRYTIVVIVTVVIIASFIGAVDLGLGYFTQHYIYSGVTH
jgi:preprotein translocase subunit SecE